MKSFITAIVFLLGLTTMAQTPSKNGDGAMEAYDFARLFIQTPNTNVLGYIGPEYERIRVKFISVIRNHATPAQYMVYGKSMVKNNVCDFQGTLTVTAVEFSRTETPGIRQGTIKGTYVLYENPAQKHVGIFKGNFVADFYLDKEGKIQYDDLESEADGFSNNQFTGTWVNYSGKGLRPCNWGDYRIPSSNDLDVGTAEFIPNEKYAANGWLNYRQAYTGPRTAMADEALAKENLEWWK